MGLWSGSNRYCEHGLTSAKKDPLWHFNFLLNLSHTHTPSSSHTLTPTHRKTHSQTHMNLEISSGQVASHPDLTRLPSSSLPPSACFPPPTSPPQLKSVQVCWKAPNEHAQQTHPPPLLPTYTHLQQAQQMSVTHWAVCGDYSLKSAKKEVCV